MPMVFLKKGFKITVIIKAPITICISNILYIYLEQFFCVQNSKYNAVLYP